MDPPGIGVLTDLTRSGPRFHLRGWDAQGGATGRVRGRAALGLGALTVPAGAGDTVDDATTIVVKKVVSGSGRGWKHRRHGVHRG